MTKVLFRKENPERTYIGPELSPYGKYKTKLAQDFKGRCGYTNCNHLWFGGKNNFHIDHFKPKSKYPKLKTKYSNLVYSCSYVNIAKGDDDFNYLDPCDEDYNKHFYRSTSGEISAFEGSERAKYMYSKLKLYLKRYSIIYMLDEIREKMSKIKKVIEGLDDGKDKEKLLGMQGELANEFLDYLKYLEVELWIKKN